jgi:glutathione peroxidase
MKRVLLFTFFLLMITSVASAQNNPVYNFKVDSVAGNGKIDFNQFRGKKILIVNTASGDSNFNVQFKELMQLYQLYYEKLVIIAVPTNSFNTEPGTNQQVAARYTQTHKYKFPVTIAGKG